jgi:hypothetical protein
MVDLMTHLEYESLLDYLEGHSSLEERGRVEMHLAESCEVCARRLGLLRKALNAAAGDRTVSPPQAVLKEAIDVSQVHQIPNPGLLARMVATLSFDSHAQLSAALTRGTARERQVLFNAGQVDIDMKISAGNMDYDLLGQVMGADARFGFASLQSMTGQLLQATELDPLGQFSFRKISPGMYDLLFDIEDREIGINGLKVGHD